MQFDRDAAGVLTPLPKPCVDTGMGLERLAAVLQHVHSNYDIDLFRDLIAEAARLTSTKDIASPSLRVIADHIRACAFLIVDGVIPGNEGRGYVLRRIIRRAIRHGYQLGQAKPFFHKLVPDLVEAHGRCVSRTSAKAGSRDAGACRRGNTLCGNARARNEGPRKRARGRRSHGRHRKRTLPGETAFTLYDTFGFPLDLTADVCRERGFTVDQAGFDTAMDKQRERARAASTFKMRRRSRIHRRQDDVRWVRYARAGGARRWQSTVRVWLPTRWRLARRGSSCSTARLSMPNRADRWAIAANCRKAAPA